MSVPLARLVAIVVVLNIGGLSSSFAWCVAACFDGATAVPASHACHENTDGLAVESNGDACPHAGTVVQLVDVSRDERAPLAVVQPTAIALNRDWYGAAAAHALPRPRPPARPLPISQILRI